jgi:hypothetical protein
MTTTALIAEDEPVLAAEIREVANIRARLKAIYGAAAGLSLRLNEPRGVVAEIDLPVHAA